MTTVYVVTSGEYSGYSINAVFSAEELAQRFIAHNGSDYRIEEYELDEIPEHDLPAWTVERDADGNTEARTASWWPIEHGLVRCRTDYTGLACYWVDVYAPTKDAAVKIGAEQIAQFRARQDGIA